MSIQTESRWPRYRVPALAYCLCAWLLLPALPAAAQSSERAFNSVMKEQSSITSAAKRSQTRVAQLAGQTSDYLADYRVAVQQLDRLKIYNQNLAQLVADQNNEKASIAQQLGDFGDVEQGIVPLMYDMVEKLDKFVELDMPFQRKERTDRVQRLRDNMESSDFTVSERYRQIMEAYQIETSYGRTIETYTATLPVDGQDTKVDMLRVGRILLAYQTPDRSITGFWDKQAGAWAELPGSYRRPVSEGIKIAKKQAAPALLELPIPAAELAR